MKVKVRLFGPLKDYRPGNNKEIILELEEGSQLGDLVDKLGIPGEELKYSLLLVNGSQSDLNKKLQDRDVISFAAVTEGG